MRFKKYSYEEAVQLLKSKENTIGIMYHYTDSSAPLFPFTPVRPSMLKNTNVYVTKMENTKWYRENAKRSRRKKRIWKAIMKDRKVIDDKKNNEKKLKKLKEILNGYKR